MAITICDHNLGLLGMVLLPSEFDPLNNKIPFAPPTYHGPAPVNAISTPSQITCVARLYNNDKEKITTFCEFHIILNSMITNK